MLTKPLKRFFSFNVEHFNFFHKIYPANHSKIAIVGSDLSGIITCSMLVALSTIQPDYMRIFANKNFVGLDGLELLGVSLKEKDEFNIPILKLINELTEIEFDNPLEYIPQENCIKTLDKEFFYDHLVITSEPLPNYDSIPGLKSAIFDQYTNVGSLGDVDMAEKTARILDKCRVEKEPKRIVFYSDQNMRQNYFSLFNLAVMFEERLRNFNNTLRNESELIYVTNAKSVCPSNEIFNEYLTNLLTKRQIKIMCNSTLQEVDSQHSRIFIEDSFEHKKIQMNYGALIAEPSYELPLHLKKSPFLDNKGNLNFNEQNLIHRVFPNVLYTGSLLHSYQTVNSFYEQGNIVSRNIAINLRNEDPKHKYELLEYKNCSTLPIHRQDRKITRLNIEGEKFEVKEEGLKSYLWETYGQTEIMKRFMQTCRWFGKHGLLKPDFELKPRKDS